MTVKFTMIFEAGKYGWSESFYREGVDLKTLADGKGQELVTARAELLAWNLAIVASRATLEGPRGPSYLKTVDQHGLAKEALARDIAASSTLVRLNTAASYRRMFHVRGVPDDWQVIDKDTGVPKLEGDALAAWVVFRTKLLDGWQLKVLAKDPQVAPVTLIGGVTVAGTDITIAAPGHNFVVGQTVQVAGIKGENARQFNRNYYVRAAVAGVSLTVRRKTISSPFEIIPGTGILRPRVYSYANITSATFRKFATRRTGGAFFVEAGAHKKAVGIQ